MTAPLILAFCAPGDRERVLSAARALGTVLYFKEPPDAPLEPPPERILLGVGPTGCASLAAHVVERGIEAVAVVVLVDPAAPWANREVFSSCAKGCDHGSTLPLGPLEPLRAVAEMVRRSCEGWPHCTCCSFDDRHRPRLVLAVCPEAPPCEACGGKGRVHCDVAECIGDDHECDDCSGTGRMLSSAEVAQELSGWKSMIDFRLEGYDGGLHVSAYPTRAALLAHGLRAALEGSP